MSSSKRGREKGGFKRKEKKIKNYIKDLQPDDSKKIPHSFIINMGHVSSNVKHLLNDFKKVMRPNAAERLRARKRNTLKDFVAMSGPLNVSHIIMFSQPESGVIMRIARLPQGPTLTFRLDEYTLIGDVISTVRKQLTAKKSFLHAPCLITNLQPTDDKRELQICAKMFLDMFPTIHPQTVKIGNLKRTCLINYDPESTTFEFRHYSIRTRPRGISKAVKKLISNKVPDLSRFKDVSDFMTKSELLSDSEAEEESQMKGSIDILKQNLKRATSEMTESVVRLGEIGPRLSMRLIKVEDGLCSGTVLFHKYIVRTAEEKLEIEKRKTKLMKQKEQRRRTQTSNVERKKLEKEKHKLKCIGLNVQNEQSTTTEEQDDRKYYMDEVGEEPEEGLFHKRTDKETREMVTPRWKKRKLQKM